MRQEELMIKDCVLHDGEPYQIRQLGIFGVNRDGEDYPAVCVGKPKGIGLIIERNEIVPIPLTPEILEKNGFELQRDKSELGTLDTYWLGSELGAFRIHRLNNGDYQFGLAKIRNVHELQHALRLCGIDKEIEL